MRSTTERSLDSSSTRRLHSACRLLVRPERLLCLPSSSSTRARAASAALRALPEASERPCREEEEEVLRWLLPAAPALGLGPEAALLLREACACSLLVRPCSTWSRGEEGERGRERERMREGVAK